MRSMLFVLCLSVVGLTLVGCGDSESSSIVGPNFVVEDWNTSHGVLTARWFITIRNVGAPGSQLVQLWQGSSDDRHSRNVIYSERHSLGF